MRPFLSQDGRTGFALNGDDIVSVFRHPQGQVGAQHALQWATDLGGRRLDAFDTTLPKFYSDAGFKPVSRLPFNDQFAPEGWDYDTFKNFNGGRPDVVHMVYDPENRSSTGGEPITSYDQGADLQRKALKEIAGRGSPLMAPQLVGRPTTSLIGEEEHLQRQREGLEPPGGRQTEWSGGRIGFAYGGAALEPLQVVTSSGTHDFDVEIADDDESRAQGLKNRASLPTDQGMLFVFDREEPVSFTMRDVRIPLDMIFVSRTGAVTNIVPHTEPESERPIPSGPPCMAVLELNGGTAARIGLKVGDTVHQGANFWTGGRISMADGGSLEPVEGNPFEGVQDSDIARAKGFPEPVSPMHARIAAASQDPPAGQEGRQITVQPRIMGHVAAAPVPGQQLTPKYLEARPQGTLAPTDPSWSEKIQQGVSEAGQALGQPVEGAERLGSVVRTGAEYAPGTSNILSGNEAYRAGQRGDYLGAALSAVGAVPIPGAAAERAGVGAIERGADGILRHADPAFQDGRIATTTPWSKKLLDDPHQSGEGTIGHDTMQASDALYPKTADIIKEMPYTGVKTKAPAEPGKKAKTTTVWTPTGDLNIPADATPEEAHEAFIEHAKSNILALHDAVPEDIREGSKQWYDGANTIAKQRAQQYDRPLENVAGVYAALSPQMDWYKNASLGDRVMDISHSKGNMPFSPEMQTWADKYLKNSTSEDVSDSAAIFDKIKDTPLGQITDPLERAHWIRAYDEAHNSRAYNIVNPDGTFGDTVKTKAGDDAGAGWGSMKDIANAVRSFDSPDMPTISNSMGAGHKVRNFYNNILNPNAPTGDVTIDTHAIAAALLRPLSSADKDTAIGLGPGGPKSAVTGAKGLYGAYAEAYRRAAAERDILPREMQSITWEAIRGLYSPAEKRSAAFRARVNGAWANHRSGDWTQQQVQQHLMTDPATGASRIRPPSWFSGAPEVEEAD
jgi:uncharacterized membrane protein (UPF0127 family)